MVAKYSIRPAVGEAAEDALHDWSHLANSVTAWPGVLKEQLATETGMVTLAQASPVWATAERAEALGKVWPGWATMMEDMDAASGRSGIFRQSVHQRIARDAHLAVYGTLGDGAQQHMRDLWAKTDAAWRDWQRFENSGPIHHFARAAALNEFVRERQLFGNVSGVVAPFAGMGELALANMIPGNAAALGILNGATAARPSGSVTAAEEFASDVGYSAGMTMRRLGGALELEEKFQEAAGDGRAARAVASVAATLPRFSLREIAQHAGVSYNSAATVVERLTKAKMLQREKSADASQAGAVFLSPEAKALYQRPMMALPTPMQTALLWARKVERQPQTDMAALPEPRSATRRNVR